jgi:UDP-N-acetyl-D-glucosamine dehydrogenase
MARFCHDLKVDLWDVINAASTKPFGFQAFRPGPGVGGHCIPIDPNYLSHRVRATLGYPFRFVELAQEINATMPGYIARRIQDQLNLDSTPLRGASVLLLGVTYKPNIADTRESPAVPLAKTLLAQGAILRFHDPLVKQFSVSDYDVPRVDDLFESLRDADICVLLQNHDEYDIDAMAAFSTRFLDTRGVARRADRVQLL